MVVSVFYFFFIFLLNLKDFPVFEGMVSVAFFGYSVAVMIDGGEGRQEGCAQEVVVGFVRCEGFGMIVDIWWTGWLKEWKGWVW